MDKDFDYLVRENSRLKKDNKDLEIGYNSKSKLCLDLIDLINKSNKEIYVLYFIILLLLLTIFGLVWLT